MFLSYRVSACKKGFTLLMSGVYLLISLCLVFLLPKANPGVPSSFCRSKIELVCKGQFIKVKNFLKRTEKISSSNRKQAIITSAFAVFIAFLFFAFSTQLTQKASFYTRCSIIHVKQPVHLINCCWLV